MQNVIDKQVCGERSREYDKDVVDTGAIEMISDEEESPIQISRLEASGMLDQLLHVTVIPRSLLKNKGNPGH